MGDKIIYPSQDGGTFEQPVTDTNDVSDGFHTFGELYQHRIILFACLSLAVKNNIRCWKSKFHHDGGSFEGWFIGGMQLPTGPVTYHLPMDKWELFDVEELERGLEWDGHTAEDALARFHAWAKAGCPDKLPGDPDDNIVWIGL